MAELLVSPALIGTQLAWVEQRCQELKVPSRHVDPETLQQTCHTGEHQGFAAKMFEYPYLECADLHSNQRQKSILLVCDRLQDPHNFGALLRTADAFEVRSCLIGTDEQVGVTSHVARASAGAVNHVGIYRSTDLADEVGRLTSNGTQTLVASHDADESVIDVDWSKPTAIVIGNEGSGVSEAVRAVCAKTVRIPTAGKAESLNAAISGSILMYEAYRARQD